MKSLRSGLAAFFLALTTLSAIAAPETSAPAARLDRLAHAYLDAAVADNPFAATALGLPGHDGAVPTATEAGRGRRIAQLHAWRDEVDAIEREAGAQAAPALAGDLKLMRATLAGELGALERRRSDRKDYAAPALSLINAIYTQLLNLPVAGVDGATAADLDRAWDDIVARLEAAPAYLERAQRLVTEPGRLQGQVGASQLGGGAELLTGALGDAAKAQLAARPQTLQRFVAARDAAVAAIQATQATIAAKVAAWPENHAMGRAAYDAMLRDELLLPYAGAEIERMGRDELAHGWAEEAWLTSRSQLTHQPFGAASGGGMAPEGRALIGYYRERIAELTEFVRRHEVISLPDWLGHMEIVETPAFLQPVSPGASMMSPRMFAKSTTGRYFITPPTSLAAAAARLDMNQDFDRDRIIQTAAHEAMPGHFLQLSIAHRQPDLVRKLQDASSFAEGWAYYGEEMFVRLGLYGDHLDGPLFAARWERVRGARAIVDPKLAAGEWSVEQAVELYERESGFTHEAAQAAVAGIALNPGYVIAYTVGRYELQTLLAEVMRRQGTAFSLRDFHDRLLSYGTVPFSVLAPELLADLDRPVAAVRAAAGW
ncbi:MAG: DUF885 domain-containing protein [Burkholderiales bacterium]|nr:DUF885 domain-containing protein [Burkholderiales bacterium]